MNATRVPTVLTVLKWEISPFLRREEKHCVPRKWGVELVENVKNNSTLTFLVSGSVLGSQDPNSTNAFRTKLISVQSLVDYSRG